MKFNEIKEKIKNYDYKKLLTGRNFIIVGSVLVVGITVVMFSLFFGGDGGLLGVGSESKKTLGNPALVDGDASLEESAEETGNFEDDSYFAVSLINRQRVRDEAMSVLQEIVENPDTMPGIKEDALVSIAAMVSEMSAESNIETLVKAKGFKDCVAIVSGDKCTVIVKTNELLADQFAQIYEIVLNHASVSASKVNIIDKK